MTKRTFREELTDELKSKRPNLGESSVKTYVSSLSNLCKQMNGNETLDWFSSNEKEILEYLSSKQPRLRKGTLSALYVLTCIESYRLKMIEDCKATNEIYKEQKKQRKKNIIG